MLLTHTTFYYHERIDALFAVWHEGGVGVPIFFVISGIVMVLSSAALPLNILVARELMTRAFSGSFRCTGSSRQSKS